MQGFMILGIIGTEKDTSVFYSMKNFDRQWSVKCRSWYVLVKYVKDNYYARFHDPSYHRYREAQIVDGRKVELLYRTLL